MRNDPALPPGRPKPKGGNYYKKPKAENRARAPKSAAGGVSPTFWLGAIGVGLLLAYISTSDASGGTGSNPNDTAALPTPTGPGTPTAAEPVIQTGPAPSAKPARRAIVAAQRPLVFVYIDSFGGEGIFDRLRTTAGAVDGHGLDRVTTLANGEFAGFYTGKFWVGTKRANGTAPTYLQLYHLIDNRAYNYWVDAEEVKQFHAPGAQAHEGWGQGTMMTATTKQLIAQWYANHYA